MRSLRQLDPRIVAQRRQAIRSATTARRLSNRPKHVIYIADKPLPRLAKLATAARMTGWKTTLLAKHITPLAGTQHFDEVKAYNSKWDALRIASETPSAIHHVSSGYMDMSIPSVFTRHRPAPLVVDIYDPVIGIVDTALSSKLYPGLAATEQACIESADGLCCRSLELQVAKRTMGLRLPDATIFFPEYCWDDIHLDKATANQGRKIRFAYAGNVPSRRPNGFLDVADALDALGIEFHVFPALRNSRIDLALRHKNIFLHDTANPDELITRLSSFDAGIQVELALLATRDLVSSQKAQYAVAGKIFDYLDAELPVVVCSQRFQRWLVMRYRSGIKLCFGPGEIQGITADEIRRLLQDAKGNVKHAKAQLSLKHHAARLNSFYEQVSSRSRQSSWPTA